VRHKKGNAKLGRPTDQRLALLGSLSRAFFINKSIKTTRTKAKEARKQIEKIITLVKKDDLSSKRQVFSILRDKDLLKDIYASKDIYAKRDSGYTRIINLGTRRGDAAQMVKLELVDIG